MKCVALIGSARSNSNSTAIVEKFLEGFSINGNTCDKFYLNKLKFSGCMGCFACRKTGKCAQKDDMNQVLDSVACADIVIFSSPIFMGNLSGQVKTALDRLYPLIGGEPGKYYIRYGVKKTILVTSQGAPVEEIYFGAYDLLKRDLKGLGLEITERLSYIGGNFTFVGDTKPEILEKAYNLGVSYGK